VSAKANREHAELLKHFSQGDGRRSFMESEMGGEQALLLEQATINRTTDHIDSVIGQAQEAFNALRFQRSTFGDISTKISTVGMKLPLVCKTLPPKFGFFWLLFPHKLNCCNMSRTACPNL
jgi:Golgi SNAP receptor complex protein 1